MLATKVAFFTIFLFVICFATSDGAFSLVQEDGNKTYIVDRTGERWDITQAKSIGFRPEQFQYGIGRIAFTPLDDSQLSDDIFAVSKNLRIIGIAEGTEAQAYSIPKLGRHEIANTKIGSKPIGVGY